MFQKTRLKLTLLNSAVFIILLAILCNTVYWYTEKQIYRDVNRSLENGLHERRMPKPPQGQFLIGPEPSRIIWGPDQTILEPNLQEGDLFLEQQKSFYPLVVGSVEEIEVEDSYFRYSASVIQTSYGELTVQFIRNVDAEKEMLDRLLLILLAGSVMGSLVAVGAGYFLAGRALIPIRKAWKQQQQFVSDASHEIRTPLSVIQSKTDLLFQEPGATVEEKAVEISVISREVRRLNKLVTGLLTLARSDSNQLELNWTSFSLKEVAVEIISHYEDIAAYQEKKMSLRMDTDECRIAGDRERIYQLLVILVDNALKFTEQGGQITIGCSKSPSAHILYVEDNGSGIETGELEKIFSRFYQAEKSRTLNEGAGLGLSIAKWIVEAHQGTLKAKSVPGVRTRFEAVFPKSKTKNLKAQTVESGR